MIHENNLIYFLETATQGSEMISPNSFCGFTVAGSIDMNLDPPFFYNSLSKHDEHFVIYCLESVEFYIRFWHDISQLILWMYLHKGHRNGFRPAIPAQLSEQKWLRRFELFFWTCWVCQKVLTWFLPTHSVELSLQGPSIWTLIRQSCTIQSLNGHEKGQFDSSMDGVGWQNALIKTC